MTARSDVKQVFALASRGMTESEYQATIRAAREFGRIQVHQHFRKLAIELGLPPECSAEPKPTRRRPRWMDDRVGKAEREIWAGLRLRAHIALALPRPGGPVRLTGVGVA